MFYYCLVAQPKFARDMNNFFLVFQYLVFRKTRKLQKAAKIEFSFSKVLKFSTSIKFFFGETVQKIWLRISDPWWKI
jgi:hypothetical protein